MVTFPQIVIDGESLGGFDQLLAADRAGAVSALLAASTGPRRGRSPGARPRLTALAHVGSAPADHDLADRRPASRARLSSRRWTRKRSRNAPRAPSTWRKSSIEAPLALDPPRGRDLLDPRPAAATAGSGSANPPRAGGWIRVRNKRLVGVDVADAGDPPLVEHERFHGRSLHAAPRCAGSRR